MNPCVCHALCHTSVTNAVIAALRLTTFYQAKMIATLSVVFHIIISNLDLVVYQFSLALFLDVQTQPTWADAENVKNVCLTGRTSTNNFLIVTSNWHENIQKMDAKL